MSEHALVWEFDRDSTTCEAVCNADEDADCRLHCCGECETYSEIHRNADTTFDGETVRHYTHDDCDLGMLPGDCNVCLFLNESGCIEELSLGGYSNGPRFTLATVPIRPSWEGDGYEWEPIAPVDSWADEWDVRPLIADRIAKAYAEGAGAVVAAVLGSAPSANMELRYDGTEDPLAASYVEGYKDAWAAADLAATVAAEVTR